MTIQCSNNLEFLNTLSVDMAKSSVNEIKKYSIGAEKAINVSIQLKRMYYNITKCILANDFNIKIETKNSDIPLNLIEDIKTTISQARSYIGSCTFSVESYKESITVIADEVYIDGDFNL